MVNTNGKTLPIIAACIMAALMVSQGVKTYKAANEKALAQDGVTESVLRWKQSYMALSSSIKRWDDSYRKEESVQDLATLYSLIDLKKYGLTSDTDGIVLNKVDPVTQNNTPIGLTRICMGNGSGDGTSLIVRAGTYQALFSGIDKLAKRSDIYIGNISVQGDKDIPTARLGDFCVFLRKG